MSKLFFLLSLFVFPAMKLWAQKMPEDFLAEARDYKFQNKESEALSEFTYLVTHYPKSKYCTEAYYNMGCIYIDKGEDRKAINIFRTMVENRSNRQARLPEIGAIDYLPSAVGRLSSLYEERKNYDSALYFLYLYDTGFHKVSGCAVASALATDRTVAQYGILNVKAGRIKEAEKAMLSRRVFYWYKYDGEVSKELKMLFTKYEDAATLKAVIDTAVSKYFFDTVYYKGEDYEYKLVYCCINFLGSKVRFAYPGTYEGFDNGPKMAGLSEREKIIANLRKSELYGIVQEL